MLFPRSRTFPKLPRGLCAVLLLGLIAHGGISWAKDRATGLQAAIESITAEDLRRHVLYLASDKLEGREAGTKGGLAAAEYLAEHYRRCGLNGGGPAGFFQPFAPNFRNVIAVLPGCDEVLKEQFVVLGGHYDHVGRGTPRNSRGPVGFIHPGADDNASGTAALLEIAEALALLPKPPPRSVLLISFDAEEKGLLGSRHWVAQPTVPRERIMAMLDVDMIGRLREEHLVVQGARTAWGLRRLVSEQNHYGLRLAFPWTVKPDGDVYPFFQAGVPVLLFHTGLHDDYHTPRDVPALLNYEGMCRVTRLLCGVVYELASRPEPQRFRKAAYQEAETAAREASSTPSYTVPVARRLGVSWQEGGSAQDGLRITTVWAGSAALTAGIQPGDRIVEFCGQAIRGGADLRRAVRTAPSPAAVVIRRPGLSDTIKLMVHLSGPPVRWGFYWKTDEAEPGTAVVTYVLPDSPADRAGLQGGDRIYQAEKKDFRDAADFAELVNAAVDSLELLMEREGQTWRTTLKSDDPQATHGTRLYPRVHWRQDWRPARVGLCEHCEPWRHVGELCWAFHPMPAPYSMPAIHFLLAPQPASSWSKSNCQPARSKGCPWPGVQRGCIC
jgi:hypothetical protein